MEERSKELDERELKIERREQEVASIRNIAAGDNKATAALAPTLKKLMTEKPLPHDVEVVVIDRTVFGWFSPWKIWIVDHGDVENARTLAHEWEHARQTAAGEKPSAENEANARRAEE